MRKRAAALLLLWALAALCGASLLVWTLLDRAGTFAERTVFVETPNLATRPGVRVLDANNAFFTVLNAEPNRVDVHWKASEIRAQHPICRMKRLDGPPTSVMGTLNSEREYPVLIDTGSPQGVIVNDVVAVESGLAIYPVEAGPGVGGLCDIEQIEIGGMTLRHPPCCYMLGHYERRAFGKRTQKERQIILGLQVMRSFQYLLIDHTTSEVEFGLLQSFTPGPSDSWRHYPLAWEGGHDAGLEVFVEIPLAGRTRRVKIDTAAAWNLYVEPNMWQGLSADVKVIESSRSRSKMFRGWTDVEKVIVEQLQVGSRTLPIGTIAVVDEGAGWRPGTLVMGMASFFDTAIVLDFGHGRFWVRQAQDE
jgi:hypothetical protein